MRSPRNSRRSIQRPEQEMQKAVARYLYTLENLTNRFTFFHPANGGKRTKAEAGIFKSMGVRAGVPDLVILFNLEISNPVFVELKAKGGSLNANQRSFHKKLEGLFYGVYTVTAQSPSHAVEQVEAILKERGVL